MAIIKLLTGSVYGTAEAVATEVKAALEQSGHTVIKAEGLDAVLRDGADAVLVCTSTTGQGDLPENLLLLYQELKERFPLLGHLAYGIIALGDSSYGDTYCGGGRLMDELLTELTAKRVAEPLMIDASETASPETIAVPWAVEWASQL
ncbi:flavodoxin [Kistimonas asteriae]|uniref:flavodoxin n=1 Tax=Kistimonas asteriae TaxID=517724 RepID=UPI001BA67DBF|nr:flavodoxin [Kistimonas asteriae]